MKDNLLYKASHLWLLSQECIKVENQTFYFREYKSRCVFQTELDRRRLKVRNTRDKRKVRWDGGQTEPADDGEATRGLTVGSPLRLREVSRGRSLQLTWQWRCYNVKHFHKLIKTFWHNPCNYFFVLFLFCFCLVLTVLVGSLFRDDDEFNFWFSKLLSRFRHYKQIANSEN